MLPVIRSLVSCFPLLLVAACSGLYGVQVGPPDLDTRSAAAPRCASPAYPGRALMMGDRGTVVVRADVEADGRIRAAAIDRSSAYADLDAASLETSRRWCRFEPASLPPGASVRSVKITFVWDLVANTGLADMPAVRIGVQPSLQ